jgi:hypothetical protein
MFVATHTGVRQFPRPGRVIQRIGNDLPDVSGEIRVRPTRAATDPGVGITRLGLWKVRVDLDAVPDRSARA